MQQPDCPLTEKQLEIVHWLSRGKSCLEMSPIVGASPSAIQKRLEHVYEKTGVYNRHGIVGMALRNGWIE